MIKELTFSKSTQRSFANVFPKLNELDIDIFSCYAANFRKYLVQQVGSIHKNDDRSIFRVGFGPVFMECFLHA